MVDYSYGKIRQFQILLKHMNQLLHVYVKEQRIMELLLAQMMD